MSFKTDEWGANDVTRALPHAVGPEKSILSSMLQDPQEYIDLAIDEGVSPLHFYLPNNAALFEFLLDLHGANQPIELVSLVQLLLDAGKLEKVGGPSYVTELYTYAPSLGQFAAHVKHVKDKFILRSLIRSANETVAEVYENPEDPNALCDAAERTIMAIREEQKTEGARTIREDVQELVKELQDEVAGSAKPLGIQTGFADFDRMTGGLKPAEVTVIAARPSMGKTSFMMNIVENICLDQEIPTLVFSAEMSQKALISRLGYCRAKFDFKLLSRGYKPKKHELQRIARAFTEVLKAPLFIDDRSEPSIDQIRAKSRQMVRKHGIKLIAIDYLQLCKSLSKQAAGNREREVAEISAGVKGLSKDLGIPIILLAQLNREADKRPGKVKGRPQTSDLRESGSIEQDADIIAFLHRPEKYAQDDMEAAALEGRAEAIIAKNRNGETGSVPLMFTKELMRFESHAPWKDVDADERKPRFEKS